MTAPTPSPQPPEQVIAGVLEQLKELVGDELHGLHTRDEALALVEQAQALYRELKVERQKSLNAVGRMWDRLCEVADECDRLRAELKRLRGDE